jgi:CelD/BcsL family acetyltransferase involved in cellulose biosynthesis
MQPAPLALSASDAPAGARTPVKAAVQRVNPAGQPGWDEQLAALPNSSFFQSAEWAEVLAGYGFVPQYFTVAGAGGMEALLPMMEVDSWLTGRRGVSLPFTDDSEPFYADAGAFKKVYDAVLEFGRSRKWKYVEFRGGRKWFGDVPASVSFYGHELDLMAGEARLFEQVDGSVRRGIRKAEKAGVTVEVAESLEAMRVFYDLLCQTRKKHGMPPQPFGFFENIHRQVLSKNFGNIFIARFEGRPIAAAVYFRLGKRAIYKYGASDETVQQLRGNNLVMWEAIKWHAAQGCASLHLGRTSLGNEGLRRFKLNWGAAEHPIEYVKYDFRQERFVQDRDESSGWHNQLFNRMPIFASRWVGAALYRHWA